MLMMVRVRGIYVYVLSMVVYREATLGYGRNGENSAADDDGVGVLVTVVIVIE